MPNFVSGTICIVIYGVIYTCLLRNLYAGQEATVRTRLEQWTGSKSGKEFIKVVYCQPAGKGVSKATSLIAF